MGDTNQEKWDPRYQIGTNAPDYKRERQELHRKFKQIIGKNDGRCPIKILIIGCPGMGKSCFGNSIITAMVDDNEGSYQEYFTTGAFDNGRQVTLRLQRFRKNDYIREKNTKNDFCWPTIFDVVGFENINTPLVKEILLLILNGYIPNNENLAMVQDYGDEHGLEALRQKYSTFDESMRIDRIIFLASAAENEELPNELMRCIVDVAKPENEHIGYVTRDIPLFGVLTKMDTVDHRGKAFRKKEMDFKLGLGIYGTQRYGSCSSYCDSMYQPDKVWEVLPKLDVPILKFLIVVCSPCVATNASGQSGQRYFEIPSYLIRMAIRMFALSLLIGICVIYSPILSKDVTQNCGMMYLDESPEIYKICEASKNNEITFITRTSIYQMLAIVFYILFELSFEPLLVFLNLL